ncbi:hypothetical protein [Paenibacillus sp. RC84]|uniref:hypothetical protein n=1 Tax=Paenibacillus sp. RC84 TaxID=3156252 RepID=UPI0035155451
MLTDMERKILRILYNFSSINKRMPSRVELGRKSGYTADDIQKALGGLKEKGYIFGEKLSEIVILYAWEKRNESREERGNNQTTGLYGQN